MRTRTVVVMGIAGWIVLALSLPALFPGSAEATRALRGTFYLAYLIVVVAALIRVRRRSPQADRSQAGRVHVEGESQARGEEAT